MKLNNLNESENEIVRKCLECVARGKVILHDFEFEAIMGVEIEEFIKIFEKWPDIDENEQSVFMLINNSMVNLLGYPHGRYHRWEEFMDVPLEKIADTHKKWRGTETGSYFEGVE